MDESPEARSRVLLRLGDIDGASRLADGEIDRIADTGNTNGLWKIRFVRAEILALRGQVEGALTYLESLPPPDARDLESCASLKMYRGGLHGSLGRYAPSHQLLDEADAMAREADQIELLGEICLSQAFLFFLQKNYPSSDRMFRAALGIAEQVGGWYFRGHGMWGIGKNLMIQGLYREAIPWLEDSLEIFEGAGARLSIALVWSELGVCDLGLGQDEKALALFRKAEIVNKEAGFVHNYQVVLANIGNVFLHRRDHLIAISYYQRALMLAREIKDPVSIKKWTYNINLAYARIRADVDAIAPPSA